MEQIREEKVNECVKTAWEKDVMIGIFRRLKEKKILTEEEYSKLNEMVYPV